MAHLGVSFEPPSTDQHEEHARYDCMQLVQNGCLNGAYLLSLRDVGAEWSTIRDQATTEHSSHPHPIAAFTRLIAAGFGMTDTKALRALSTALQSHAQELRLSAQEARNRSIALRDHAETVRHTGSVALSRSRSS
jgi:hypothetical protein